MALEKDLDSEIGRKLKLILLDQLKATKLKESDIRIDSEWSDLGADYIDLLEMRTKIEKEYEIEVIDEEAKKIYNVGKAIDYITSNYKPK